MDRADDDVADAARVRPLAPVEGLARALAGVAGGQRPNSSSSVICLSRGTITTRTVFIIRSATSLSPYWIERSRHAPPRAFGACLAISERFAHRCAKRGALHRPLSFVTQAASAASSFSRCSLSFATAALKSAAASGAAFSSSCSA